MTANEQHEAVMTMLKSLRSDAALIARQNHDLDLKMTRMETALITLRAVVGGDADGRG